MLDRIDNARIDNAPQRQLGQMCQRIQYLFLLKFLCHNEFFLLNKITVGTPLHCEYPFGGDGLLACWQFQKLPCIVLVIESMSL